MIQQTFTFTIGEAGDTNRRSWLFHDFLKTAAKNFDSGAQSAVRRDLLRAIKLNEMGSPVAGFVRDSIILGDKGDTISAAEAWECYALEMGDNMRPNLTKLQFDKMLPTAMEEFLGIFKLHNIKRNGRSVRGYRGCKLRGVYAPSTKKSPPLPPKGSGEPSLE